ncbi:MAG: bifunctional nicotinamidase/pyrazinamidase [Bdellovibrionota bacterium]
MGLKSEEILVFAVPEYEYLQEALCRTAGYTAAKVSESLFPNGEIHKELNQDVDYRGKHAILIGSTDDAHFLSVLDYARELVPEVESLSIVVPFYRYATQERRSRRGEVIIAKNRAEMLSDLPQATIPNKVVLIDLHAEVIRNFFNSDRAEAISIRADQIMSQAIREYIGTNIVLASADSGRHDWIKEVAGELGAPYALINKERLSGTETRVIGEVLGDVRGKDVVIYDDMIRSGGTALKAAEKYLEAGARSVTLAATHADFTPDAIAKIKGSRLIKQIIVSDTWPGSQRISDAFVKVVSSAGLIQQVIDRELKVSRAISLAPTNLDGVLENLKQDFFNKQNKEKKMKVLIVVDPQNDFCPGGNLAVPEGDQVIPIVNKLLNEGSYDLRIATRDWHPVNHECFSSTNPDSEVFTEVDHRGGKQVIWPDHCVQGTIGAEFHPDFATSKLDKIISKGDKPEVHSYSAFWDDRRLGETELRSYIEQEAAKRGLTLVDVKIDVVGLALDYCVAFTALDAKDLGCDVSVVLDATRAVNINPGDDLRILRQMQEKGIDIIESHERLPEREVPRGRDSDRQQGMSA